MVLNADQYNRSYAWHEYDACEDYSDLLYVLLKDCSEAEASITKLRLVNHNEYDVLVPDEVGLDASVRQFRSFLQPPNIKEYFDKYYVWKLGKEEDDNAYTRLKHKTKALRTAADKFKTRYKLSIKKYIDYRDNLLQIGGINIEFEIGSFQDCTLKTLFNNPLDGEWKSSDLISEIAKIKDINFGTEEYEELFAKNIAKRSIEEINRKVKARSEVEENLILKSNGKVRLNPKVLNINSYS